MKKFRNSGPATGRPLEVRMNRLVRKLVIYGLKRQLRRQAPMSRVMLAVGGVGVGAAAMYLLGPQRRRGAIDEGGAGDMPGRRTPSRPAKSD
jgi:hypothetical protein